MALLPGLQAAQAAVEELVPRLAEARRNYVRTQSDADRLQLDDIQQEASKRLAAFDEALASVQAATGFPPELFEQMAAPELRGDRTDRRRRATLTADEVEPTACVDDNLAHALERLTARLPAGWLELEPAELFRLPADEVDRPFSIVKGFRPESERPGGHRLRQMIYVARDRLAEDPRYDHFAGALLVPQLTRLGMRLELLDTVPGAAARIETHGCLRSIPAACSRSKPQRAIIREEMAYDGIRPPDDAYASACQREVAASSMSRPH